MRLARNTGAHFSDSELMRVANCASGVITGSRPSAASWKRVAGFEMAAAIRSFSQTVAATTAVGSPNGAESAS